MSYLTAITRSPGQSNMGGIFEIRVARKADISNMPAPVNGIIYGDIDFLPGRGFHTWQVIHQSAGADGDARQTREGDSRQNRLSFKIPKVNAVLTALFGQMVNDEFVLLFTDSKGQKVFGQLSAPARFSYNIRSGQASTDLNHYECEFYYAGPDNIHEYNGTVSSAPAGPAPAIVRFNGSAIAVLAPGETLNITSDYSFSDYFTSSTTT